MGLALMPSQPVNDRMHKVDIVDFDMERTIGLRWSPKRADGELSELLAFAPTFDWSTVPAN
jgi:hypothetical protein